MKQGLLLIILSLFATTTQAQGNSLYSTVPLNKTVTIHLTYCDSTILPYYYMYSFDYFNGREMVKGELLVPKKDEPYLGLVKMETKLCKINTFVNTIAKGKYVPMKVNDYIQVILHGGKDTLFLNFDTSLPEAVLTLCRP